jgi:uncharacterized protein YndB with AHSA1/START domain
MTDLSIQREIVIDAPADVVWRTITEPAQIERWFFDRVELDVQPGGRGTFAFKGRETGEPVTVAIVVETVDAPRRFAFRWGRPTSGTPEPAGSILVDFTLSPEGAERTRLRVVETGLDTVGWPEEEKSRYADDHRRGWEEKLGALAALFGPSRDE